MIEHLFEARLVDARLDGKVVKGRCRLDAFELHKGVQATEEMVG